MVYELQFIAIATFLIWCLVSSLVGVLDPEPDEERLVWRERGPAGWSEWREVHYGLTAAHRRVLAQPDPVLDQSLRDTLRDTVCDLRHPDSDVVQFAVVRMPSDGARPSAVFVSGQVAVASVGAR